MFRFTSPLLHEIDERDNKPGASTILHECPIGLIIRETPHVFSAISAANYAENGALNPIESTQWLQDAISIVVGERDRLRRTETEKRQSLADSAKGRRVLSESHG